jgi:uncharacterized LabA/DUF88 family protein
MSRLEQVIFERLGRNGLTLVLDDLLDRSRLVKLANACELKYPGSRTTSQTRERLLGDLTERAAEDEATRKAILRVLHKETRSAARKWNALPPEEKVRRLGDERYLLTGGNLGLHLYILASADGEKEQTGFETLLAQQQLLRLGADGKRSRTKDLKPSRAETRLRKRVTELEKKVLHLEGQLAKSRDTEKNAKRKLIQRKGELAESRMLVERLQRDLSDLRAVAGKQSASPAEGAIGDLTKAVRKLASEQRKLAYRVEKLPATPATPDPALLDPLLDPIKMLPKELASLKRETKKELQEQGKRLEEMRTEVAAQRKATGPQPAKAKRARPKSAAARVGVFIDVQNMYYGARQLKGKIDFDSLLQAAVGDRRLIQATAYVVESKEIDQSGFIALLQQRAIEVRRKTLQVRADGSMKGDWDMELALEILEAAPRLDVVVLVSGDGDFTSLVKRVKKMGPRVEVIGFPRNTAKSLVQASDRFQPLDRKFMIYPKRSERTTAQRGRATTPAPAARSAASTRAATKGAAGPTKS